MPLSQTNGKLLDSDRQYDGLNDMKHVYNVEVVPLCWFACGHIRHTSETAVIHCGIHCNSTATATATTSEYIPYHTCTDLSWPRLPCNTTRCCHSKRLRRKTLLQKPSMRPCIWCLDGITRQRASSWCVIRVRERVHGILKPLGVKMREEDVHLRQHFPRGLKLQQQRFP